MMTYFQDYNNLSQCFCGSVFSYVAGVTMCMELLRTFFSRYQHTIPYDSADERSAYAYNPRYFLHPTISWIRCRLTTDGMVHNCRFVFREAGPASEMPPADRRQLLARDSCSTFLYYATGSRRCSGVLVRIELANRHDLFMLLWGLFNPSSVRTTDRVAVEVAFGDDDIEPLVFAVAPKKDAKKLLREVPHLQDYTTVTKGSSSLLPPGLVCLSESSALGDPLLQPAAKVFSEHGSLLELLHVTDQNETPILGQEETPRKVLRFAFQLPPDGDSVGPTRMMALALDYIDIFSK